MSCLPCLLSPWTGIIRRSHRIPSVYAASIYRDVTKIALTPPPRHITLPSSPRLDATSPRYLSSHLPPPSRSSSRSSSPPENFLAASLLPSLRVSVYTPVQSPTTLRNTKISLSLPSFIFLYLSVCLRLEDSLFLEDLQKFLSPNPPTVTRKSKKKKEKRKITRGSRFLLYDSSTMIPRINHHIKSHQQLPLPLLVSLTRTSFFLSFTPFFLSSSSPFSSPSLLTLPSSPPRPNIIAAKNDGIPRSR